MKCTCKQCGKTFELTPSEISFYKRKKLRLPKRCKECREENKKKTEITEEKNVENQFDPEILSRNEQLDNESNKLEAVSDNNRKNTESKKKGIKKHIVSALAAVVVVVGGITGALNGNVFDANDDFVDNNVNEPAVYESINTEAQQSDISFRNEKARDEHYKKHGIEMGFSSAEA